MRELGLRLRQLRHERGETLDETSKATGISVAMLSRIETGQRHPSLGSVQVLARHFGLPVEEFTSLTIANRMVDRYGAESSRRAAERIRDAAEAEGEMGAMLLESRSEDAASPRRYGAFSEMPIAEALAAPGAARAGGAPSAGRAVRRADAPAQAARPHRDLWVPEGVVADEALEPASRDLDSLNDAGRVAEVALESAMAAVRRARASGDPAVVAAAERVAERLRAAVREG